MEKEILIIDDSWTTLVLLEWFLADNGFKPIIVQDVDHAMKYLKDNKPSLILLDLQMPKVSGYDFLSEYRINEKINKIPVVIISANDTTSTINSVKELGAVGFVPKPFQLDELLRKIEEYI